MKAFNEILGKYVEIPHDPRIVSLAPSITDILYQIGAWRNVVGVSIYCNIPPEAREKPRVGAYLKVIDKRLRELNPDIIYTTTGAQRETTFKLIEDGYRVYPVPLPVSLYGILENMFQIADTLGYTDNAVSKAQYYIDLLNKVRGRLDGKVYYEIDLGGPITAGRNSYIHTVLMHIGLDNIYGSFSDPWIQPDPGYVLEKNPDLILYEVKPGSNVDMDTALKYFIERGLGDVNAVKEGRVVVLEPDTIAHYGPTLFEKLVDLVKHIEKIM